MPSTACADPEAIRAYARGTLDAGRMEELDPHLDVCPDCQAALAAATPPPPRPRPPVVPGVTLTGDPPAAGGMGQVYRGTDDDLGREVAVKVLHENLLGAADLTRLVWLFGEECVRLSRCQHAGVPVIIRRGTLPRDGRPFMVMPWIEHTTLREVIAAGWAKGPPDPVTVDRLVRWFLRVCDAAAYAHARGVVHLDIKPTNILIRRDGSRRDGTDCYLIDWGLSRRYDRPQDGPPGPGRVETDAERWEAARPLGGTAGYMSAEQAANAHARLGPAMDVFALGAVLTIILTGDPAYKDEATRGDDLTATRAGLWKTAVEVELAAVARRCLADDPADRPADAGAVAAAVRAIREAAGDRARRAELDLAAARLREAEAQKAAADAAFERQKFQTRRWIRRLGTAVAAGIGAAAATVVFAAHDWDIEPTRGAVADLAAWPSRPGGNTKVGAHSDPVERARALATVEAAHRQAVDVEAALGRRRPPDGSGLRGRLYPRFVFDGIRSWWAADLDADVREAKAKIDPRLREVRLYCRLQDAVDRARAEAVFHPFAMPAARPDTLTEDEREEIEAKFLPIFTALRTDLRSKPAEFESRLRESIRAEGGSYEECVEPLISALDGLGLMGPKRRADSYFELAARLDEGGKNEERRAVRAAVRAGAAGARKFWDDPRNPQPTKPALKPGPALLLAGRLAAGGDWKPATDVLRQCLEIPSKAWAPSDAYWAEMTLGAYLTAAANRKEGGPPAADHFARALRYAPAPPGEPDNAYRCARELRDLAGEQEAYARARGAPPDQAPGLVEKAVREYPDSALLREFQVLLLWDRLEMTKAKAAAEAWAVAWDEAKRKTITPRAYAQALVVAEANAEQVLDRQQAAKDAFGMWRGDAADGWDLYRAQFVLGAVGAVKSPEKPKGADPAWLIGSHLPAILRNRQELNAELPPLFWLPPGAAENPSPADDQEGRDVPWSVSLTAGLMAGHGRDRRYGDAAGVAGAIARWVTGDTRRRVRKRQFDFLVWDAALNPDRDRRPASAARDGLVADGIDPEPLDTVWRQQEQLDREYPLAGTRPEAGDPPHMIAVFCNRTDAAVRRGWDRLAVGYALRLVQLRLIPANKPFQMAGADDPTVFRCLILVSCGYRDCPGRWREAEHEVVLRHLVAYLKRLLDRSTDPAAADEIRAVRQDPVVGDLLRRLTRGDENLRQAIGNRTTATRLHDLLSMLAPGRQHATAPRRP